MLCTRKNVYRMPVTVAGHTKLICDMHGCSTHAIYDAISDDLERRARVQKHMDGYRVSRMHQTHLSHYPYYQSSLRGRHEYKNIDTAIKECEKFIG